MICTNLFGYVFSFLFFFSSSSILCFSLSSSPPLPYLSYSSASVVNIMDRERTLYLTSNRFPYFSIKYWRKESVHLVAPFYQIRVNGCPVRVFIFLAPLLQHIRQPLPVTQGTVSHFRLEAIASRIKSLTSNYENYISRTERKL